MEITTKTAVKQFADLVFKGIDFWMQAGAIVSKAMDADPDFAEKVSEEHPEISQEMVHAFDRIGRKELHPRLLLSDKPGPRRLRRLPFRLQERHITEPVSVLVQTSKGWETLKMSIHNLTPSQASQVFDADSIRDEAAQRAWIQDRAAIEKVIEQHNEPYRITGGKLVIMEPCQFTPKQIAQILAQM